MYRPIKTLKVGETLPSQIFLVKQFQVKKTKTKSEFAQLILTDVTGDIKANIWDWSDRTDLTGHYVKLEHFTIDSYNDSLNISVQASQCVLVGKPDNIEDYIEGLSDGQIQVLWDQVIKYIQQIENHHIRAIVEFVYRKPKYIEKIKTIPAGVQTRGTYRGGFLEHLTRVLAITDFLTETYAGLGVDFSRDIIIAATLLHDLGKNNSYKQTGDIFEVTTEERLFGHLSLSFLHTSQIIKEVEEEIGETIDQNIKSHLLHAVLAHHGKKEFGSPVEPKTIEAMILHCADMVDSRLTLILETKNKINEADEWSERNFFLGSEVWAK